MNKGYVWTEEQKKHISNVCKQRGVGKWMLGKKRSKSSIKKQLESKKGYKHSQETKNKISNAHKGEKNYNWKGGITPERKKLYFSFEYKLWRKAVFERDRYTCVFCGLKTGGGKRVTLNADHIKPWSLYPELRFAIDNGRTLCEPCHRTTDTYGAKILKIKNKKQ